MSKFTTITHVLAVVSLAVIGWLATPAGQAVQHQYPWLSAAALALGALKLTYHTPTK